MFKGKHQSVNSVKQASLNNKRINAALLPVLSFEQLFNDRRKEILHSIRQLVSLPLVEYEAFYLKAIIHFAEFVQQLPDTAHSYYSHVGGLLDHGLERAHIALSLCRSYLLPPQRTASELSPLHELWLYAIFTAALLLDVGKLATKQVITLFDTQGDKLRIWQPSTGAMVTEAAYYQYEFLRENLDRLKTFYTPLLAQQILSHTGLSKPSLPFNGFDWIASNHEVLEAWLAILNEDSSGGGHLLTIIPIAQAQTVNNYFIDANKGFTTTPAKDFNLETEVKPENLSTADTPPLAKTTVINPAANPKSLFQPTQVAGTSGATIATAATTGYIAGSIASAISPTLAAGEAFLQWLRRNIALQTWINNPNAPIQRVKEGLFIAHPKLIQEFCRENPKYGHWQTVHDQFNQLDIALNNGKIQTYYNPNSNYKKLQQGILINPHLFLSNEELAKIMINPSFIKLAPEAIKLQVANIGPELTPNNSLL